LKGGGAQQSGGLLGGNKQGGLFGGGQQGVK